jgi:hypothetical protein
MNVSESTPPEDSPSSPSVNDTVRCYIRWKEHEVMPFLESYQKHSASKKGKPLWQHIQLELQHQGIRKTKRTLEKKWNNLLHRYNKEGKSDNFPYYHKVREILEEKRRREIGFAMMNVGRPESWGLDSPPTRQRSATFSSAYYTIDKETVQLRPFHHFKALVEEFDEELHARDAFFSVFTGKLRKMLSDESGNVFRC